MEMQIDDIFEEILGTTLSTYRVLRQGGPDVERLYFFYLYTAKLQKTRQIYSTTGFTSRGLDIGEKRVHAAKKYLVGVGLIEDARGKDGRYYVRLKYVFKRETVEGYADNEAQFYENVQPSQNGGTGENGQTGRNGTPAETATQMLEESTFGTNILKLKENACVPDSKKNEAPYSCPVFREFWELYPKKVDKPKAWALWAKLPDADRIQALEGLKAWKRLWNTFGPDDLRFVIYPERFIKLRRFEPETLSTELAQKLKERKVSSPEDRTDALSKEEAAKKRADEKAADEERASARIKRETAEILRFFEAMPDQSRELMEAEAEKKCAGFAESRTKYPQAYQAAYRSALVGLVRPVWESSKE